MINAKYKKAVKFLESLNNIPGSNYMNKREKKTKGYDRSFFIKRLKYLLDLVGNPEKKLEYIHIAGTAGKGSTTAAIHNVLKSKYKVGSYYSPHTTAHIERIRVNNKYITPNAFANIVESLKTPLTECALKSPYGVPSYFEVFLTIAFLYFVQRKCKLIVLEAGLGGKFDATNVIRNTKIAIVTNVNYDHQNVLGNTLNEIAKNKVEIIKPGCTFITTESRPQILKMFKARCAKDKIEFISLKYKNEIGNKNNLIAKKVGELLEVNKQTAKKAIKRTKLPCRFETIQASPRIIIDGSHNPVKIKRLAENLETVKYKKLVLMFAMVSDKDSYKSLKEIAHLADHIVFTRSLSVVGGRKTTGLKTFQKIIKDLKIKAKVDYFLDPWQALNFSLSLINSKDCLTVTGSMYLVGDLRKKWINEEHILSHRRSF
jgi:dihydrofolate synthase / folylpolyglutamate synthase